MSKLMGTATNACSLPRFQLAILLLVTFFFDHSLASPLWSLSTFFNVDLFPVVNVTFVNEASHSVDLLCNADETGHRLESLRPGEVMAWKVRDVLFPLVWCYVEINDVEFGVFWGYMAKLRCFSHCDWRIRDEGMFLRRKYEQEDERMWLTVYGGTF